MENEVWFPIPGYENRYSCSTLGRVIKHCSCRGLVYTRIMFLSRTTGYLTVMLSKNSKRTHHKIHRILALYFFGPHPIEKPFVNHIDGNKFNNSKENLEWVSNKENVIHYINDLGGKKAKKRAENHPRARFSNNDIHDMKKMHSDGFRICEISRKFNASDSTINNILKGRRYASVC